VWELIFLMLVLKIPIAYLCFVVWWAVKAEPRPPESAARLVEPVDPQPRLPRRFRLRGPRRGGPHGGPARSYPRTARAALAARAEADR
jgi:hypothetical protein